MGPRPQLLLLGVLGIVLACGPRPAPARQRLWTLPGAILPAGPRAREVERTLLEADFVRHAGEWKPIADPAGLDPGAEPGFQTFTGSEDGREFVTLEGTHGGLLTLIPVEPGTCYEFEGLVRTRDLLVHSSRTTQATFWLGEVSVTRLMDQMLRWKNAGTNEAHLMESAAGTSGWQRREVCFRTRSDTRGVLLACLLSDDEGAVSGAVDFADVRLRRIPAERYWDRLLTDERESRTPIDLPGLPGNAVRVVRARLGNEDRPSILLFPGERVRFSLRVPDGDATLACGVGPWLPGLEAGERGSLSFSLRADGREIGRIGLELPEAPREVDWSPLSADVRAAGSDVVLELALEGEVPGVFGAPVLSTTPRAPRAPNLILVSIDTLRADHVGAYGSANGSTPVLDRMAREGTLFLSASAQSSWTLPSHATLFSGQFPAVHGATRVGRLFSAGRSPALSEILAAHGYATQAFTGGGFLGPAFGFDHGFDGFADVDPLRSPSSAHFEALRSALGDETAERRVRDYGLRGVLEWLEERREQPFFLFLHTYAVHDFDATLDDLPCRPAGCTSQTVRFGAFGDVRSEGPLDDAHIVHLYDAALAEVDRRIGVLLDRLGELDLAEDTIVVVTSDHGEELQERGAFGHGGNLHEELLRVPLILRVPGRAPGVVEHPAMLVDVAPTCLALLGIPPDRRMQGIDLLGPQGPDRPIWGELDIELAYEHALRDPQGWKLLRSRPTSPGASAPKLELFHLPEDPGERNDLAAREPAKVEELEQALQAELEACEQLGATLGSIGTGELDEATLERLRALGYLR